MNFKNLKAELWAYARQQHWKHTITGKQSVPKSHSRPRIYSTRPRLKTSWN